MSDETKLAEMLGKLLADFMVVNRQVKAEMALRIGSNSTSKLGGWLGQFWDDPVFDDYNKGMLITIVLLVASGGFNHSAIDSFYDQLVELREAMKAAPSIPPPPEELH